ncbi:MAG TPA: hypothetical protein VF988_11835 [Verrucomicrobiae bacterium]
MIRYSHVALMVLCRSRADADAVTAHLGIEPSVINEDKIDVDHGSGLTEEISYTWVLHSPKSATDANPTGRLLALADIIAPFAHRLPALDPKLRAFVDIVYHVTPQYPDTITGEFDWFKMPAELMLRLGTWNLDVSYETFWFDHPDSK